MHTPSTTTEPLHNFLGGRAVPAHGRGRLPLIDPATEEPYGEIPLSDAADVDAAVAAAAAAFPEWRDTTPAQRQLALFRIADEMAERAEEFADLESRDTGKPRATLVADEIEQSIDQLRFFAGAARSLEGRAAAEYVAGHTSFVRREPIGVIAQVTPWNYPLNMAVWKIAPALAAGNTVVLKPAEATPLTTLLLAEIVARHTPPGVFNVVLGDRDTGAALIAHPVPQMVAITGSVRAGMAVARSAADDVKRVHLELGGKAPALVFADAALDRAVEGIVAGAFFNAGQDCTAATRVLVHASKHDELVAALVARARTHARTGGP
ncbi:aldehyde dehydrogenase family protein, partial [Microbacterium sp. K41]|uniref:aldehyde dehydrogenase family protein n=1 Tax=Microbacterium sp. K41 TaxID=2305437 RepID=UPI00109CECAB